MRAVCIVGPTASGKTGCALALARALGGEILSCDSVAVYRGLDIGAAKPSPLERQLVPHHLIDVAAPDQPFSAAQWAQLADAAAAEVAARGRPIVVAGGTGLYLRAWLRGLVETPSPDAAVRSRHRAQPVEALFAQLARVDPASAARIAPGDKVRVSRALEIYEQTGLTMTELLRRQSVGAPRIEALLVGLAPTRAELYSRIDARVEAMMARGLLAEVRALVEKYGEGARALRSLGYAQLRGHLRGQVALPEAVERIKRASRQLARRQLTWFRSEPGVIWYPSPPADLSERAARFLEEGFASAHGPGNG
ncbi:MAG TPA: tRNA (adenosine(37)-N6)-dimethylallyltransferase MiaA [Polyangia bacterium]|nr:tRNA (adenosine(37)-N6)-dimethylallyltransferase MiaA [Polyangia bacterium]